MDGRATFGPFVLDCDQRRLTRNGQPIPVTYRGYILLETLLGAAGQPVPKDVLIRRIWPGLVVEEGNLTVLVSAVRKQLGDEGPSFIVTVPRVGYRIVTWSYRTTPISSRQERGGPPTIAVLPFDNYGREADDGHFADGVVDDIITALSRFKSFAVLSRGASFALRDSGADARAAVAGLGVRYALEGSIRRMNDRLRVTAQLFDAANNEQLWAERYDGPLADIFSFQDRITESVVGIIEPEIRKAEIERVRRKPAQSLDAYDLFLKAQPLVIAAGTDQHPEAIDLLQRATELDPSFALPPAYAAWIYEKRISLRAAPLGNNDAETAILLARKALALGSNDPVVRAISAWVLYRVGGELSAVDAARRAVRDNPNHVVVLQLAASVLGLHGGAEEAFRCFARAYELSPGGPEAYSSLFGMASCELILGNNEAAISWALKSLATFNDLLFTYITLTAAYANLDRMEEARAMLRKVRELHPHLTVKLILDGVAKEDSFAWAVIPGLKKAGLPQS
jgi:TolB-like protein